MCVTAKDHLLSSWPPPTFEYIKINDVEDRVINGMLNEISYDFFFQCTRSLGSHALTMSSSISLQIRIPMTLLHCLGNLSLMCRIFNCFQKSTGIAWFFHTV